MSECASCGSVSGSPTGRVKEGRKMKSDKNSFHTLSAIFFHFGLFVDSQGYSNVLEI